MKEFHQDLSNHRTYLWIILGSFLGIALVMFAYKMLPHRSPSPANQTNSTVSPVNATETKETVSPSYEKALQNPDKPFTDENGVVHPPLGNAPAPTPIDPNNQPPAPPVNSAPIVPPTTSTKTTVTATKTTATTTKK